MKVAPAATRDQSFEPAPAPVVAGLPVRSDGGQITLLHHRQGAIAERRRQFPLRLFWFVMVVVLPGALAGVYYFSLAADQYVAEFRFALRSVEPAHTDPGGLFQGSVAPTSTGLDSYVIAQYIASRAVVEDVGRTIDLAQMFSRSEADWWARLDPPVPIEELVRYWKGQVDAFYDPTNGTIVVKARAFTPQDALTLAQGILASSERVVNELSARARRDAVRSSENDVRRAERRLKAALAKLRDFRDKEGTIDPRKTADATAALAGRVRDELVRADTELSTLKHYMRSDAPSVKMLEARIQSLEEKTRSEALSRVMGSYEQLESERTFAEKAYQHALEALDRSRMNADRQQVYIASFVQPSLPEASLYPRRLLSISVVLVICCALWMIGGLAVHTVREHL